MLGTVASIASLTLVAQTPAAGTAQPQGGGRQGGGRGDDPFEGADLSPKEPITGVSPAEEQKRFLLPPGYRIEPVLTEPDIETMQIAFDGNGRMFVLEIRAYMQDADATNELAPTGRISVHEDVNNDGVYEKHAVFVDKLVFPRFVMPMGANAVLSMESNQDEVWKYTDTDGDAVADKKELFTTAFGRAGNVEHQQSSLMWALDNWMYSTYNTFRVRWTPTGVLREPTAPNNSQWGITQDSTGRVWFQGGASGLPGYFQLPIHYGLTFPAVDGGRGGHQQFLERGFEIPWGVAGVGDFQPGTSTIREGALTLNRVTGAAGNDIVRAHRMPDDLQGDYLYGEPVARIVRRVKPIHAEGITTLRQVYQSERSEFIRSSDHLFRPVDVATAPDGTIYIVDPSRGSGAMKAPSFAGSQRVLGHQDYVIKAILHGLSGPLEGRNYTDVMVPMGANRDEWVAAIASYVRNSFGNSATVVTTADVARARAAVDRKTPWTQPELEASLPTPLVVQATWKVTASHNPQTAAGGLNFQGWTTGAPQQPGMWFQIELGEPATLTEIQFTSTLQTVGENAVAGARGGGPATPPPPPIGTYPRSFRVETSMDGASWGTAVATGEGGGLMTAIAFRPVRAKFVRITQTATSSDGASWTMQRMRLYQAPGRPAGSAMR
jgi:glucose/arabinose dehydrogenase